MRTPRRSLAVLLALIVIVAAPGIALADDPDCRALETDGSAGLDLRLLCTIGEIVGHYTGETYESPSDVPVLLLGSVVAGVGALAALLSVLLVRLVSRWAAPRRPPDDAWWTCAACRSFNEPTVSACYHCGLARPP
jgi:hypothetical protein